MKIESVMDEFDSTESMSDLKVQEDAIIETVAEAILSSSKPVTVIDKSGQAVGVINAAKIVHVLFGDHSNQKSENLS